ncbi:MAG TPA: heparin lyase I family protein, partial [Azospirillum sp.]
MSLDSYAPDKMPSYLGGYGADDLADNTILLLQPSAGDTGLNDLSRPAASPFARTLTAFGGAAISTSWSAYGSASLHLPGADAHVVIAPTISLTGNFTLRLRLYAETVAGRRAVIGQWQTVAGQGGWLLALNEGRVEVYLGAYSELTPLLTGGDMAAFQEVEIEVNRDGDLFRLLFCGTVVATATFAGAGRTLEVPTTLGNVVAATGFVGAPGWEWYHGYVDGLHAIDGFALHTTDYAYVGPTTPQGPPTPPPALPVWTATFTAGNALPDLGLIPVGNTPIPIGLHHGARCVAITLDHAASANKTRTQVQPNALPAAHFSQGLFARMGQEYWYGVRLFLPSAWTEVDSADSVLVEFHGYPAVGAPVAALATRKDGAAQVFALTVRWNGFDDGRNGAQDSRTYTLGDITPWLGSWVTWVFHVRWGYAESQSPLFELYRNGGRLVEHTLPNCYKDTFGPYVRFGLHKGEWATATDTGPNSRTLFIDNLAIADATGTLASVNLAGDRRTTPPDPPQAPPPVPVQSWKTSGHQILDAADRPIRLTGVNLAGAEHADLIIVGLWARGYKAMLAQIKALGFNCVRIPICDALVTSTKTTWTSVNLGVEDGSNADFQGKTPLEALELICAHCRQIGLLVILDHHRTTAGTDAESGTLDHGMWYDGAYSQSAVIDNWKKLAQRFAGNPAVIGADLHNEPHCGLWGPTYGRYNGQHWGQPGMAVTIEGGSYLTGGNDKDIALFYEAAGNAIHQYAPHWLIVCEGVERTFGSWAPQQASFTAWGENLCAAKPGRRPIQLAKANRLVYSTHHYLFGLPQHIANAASFPDNLPAWWDDLWGWAYRQAVAPVLVGEIGGFMDTDRMRAWIRKFHQYARGDVNNNGTTILAAGQQGVHFTMWCWGPLSGDTGGILGNDWRTVVQPRYSEYQPHLFTGPIALPDLTGGSAPPPLPEPEPTPDPAVQTDDHRYRFPDTAGYTTVLENQTLDALNLTGQRDVWVKNCVIDGSALTGSTGVWLENSHNIRIEGCQISGHQFGILLSANGSTSDVVIHNNTIESTQRYAIIASQRGNGTSLPVTVDHPGLKIVKNVIRNTGLAGAALPASQRAQNHALYIQAAEALVQDNRVSDSLDGAGISMRSSGRVIGNEVERSCVSGIEYHADHYPGASNQLVIEYNRVSGSSRGASLPTRPGGVAGGIELTGFPTYSVPHPWKVVPAITIRYNWVNEGPNPDIVVHADHTAPGSGVTVTRFGNVIDGVGAEPPPYSGGEPGTPPGGTAQPPGHTAGTVLLCNFDAGLVDEEAGRRAPPINLLGTARIAASPHRAGGGAIVLDGSAGTGVVVPHSSALDFGTADCAMEVMFRKTVAGPATIMAQGRADGAGAVWSIHTDGTDALIAEMADAAGGRATLTLGPCPLDADTYVALARTADAVYGYVDGVRRKAMAFTGTLEARGDLSLGRDASDGNRMVGRLYGARLTNGSGRGFTAAAIPNLKSFPAVVTPPGQDGGEPQPPPPPPPPVLTIIATDADKVEGSSGSTPFTFTVTRTGTTTGTSTVTWTVAGSGTSPAAAADFVGNAFPAGTLTFAAGEAAKTITVAVAGDGTAEATETFTVTLSNPFGATIGTAAANGTIRNSATPPPATAPLWTQTFDTGTRVTDYGWSFSGNSDASRGDGATPDQRIGTFFGERAWRVALYKAGTEGASTWPGSTDPIRTECIIRNLPAPLFPNGANVYIPGTEMWFGERLYLPSADWSRYSEHACIITQFHATPTSGSPPLALQYDPNGGNPRWLMACRSTTDPSDYDGPGSGNADTPVSGPLSQLFDRWTNVAWHLKWTYAGGSDGFARLYFDGVKVAERLGPICYPYEPAKPNQGPYWKAGLYCWGWGSQYTVA